MSALERWLPPAVLVGIALIQAILVFSRDLTPWKGGGFGMFASTDALNMRLVECEGLTPEGETIRIDALNLLDSGQEDSARAMPSLRTLVNLGFILQEMEFVPGSIEDEVIVELLRRENPDAAFPEPIRTDEGFHRPVRSSDPGSIQEQAVSLQAVRLRWWKIRFDPQDRRLYTEPLLEPVVIGDWPGVDPSPAPTEKAAPSS